MYRKNKVHRTTIDRNTSVEGETIEQKVERIVENKETITDGAPLIYEDRRAGINPAYDIRTDRFEIAAEAADQITKSKVAKREAKVVPLNDDAKGESTDGQGSNSEGGNTK